MTPFVPQFVHVSSYKWYRNISTWGVEAQIVPPTLLKNKSPNRVHDFTSRVVG